MEEIKVFGIMRYMQTKEGELYLNLDDIIKVIEAKKPMMTKVMVEHLVMDKFIHLLKRYEEEIKKLP